MKPESVFPSYPEYKDSGVEWLGNVPSHWEIWRAWALLVERNDFSLNGQEALLSVSEYYGVKPRTEVKREDEFDSRAESLEGYRICRVGDFVMNYMLAWKGSHGVTNYEGIVSPAYAVFRFIGVQEPSYFHNLLRTPTICAEFRRFSSGIIDSRLRLYPEDFLHQIKLPIPPLPEQQAIANFLDQETVKIDTLIAKQERLIALLTEKRQAVISHAVTKGLNPSAARKESGVEWLGDVPSHWEVKAIKRQYSVVGGSTPKSEEPDFWDGDIQWVTPADIGKLSASYIGESQRKITFAGLQSCSASLVPSDSLIVSTRAPIGSIAIAQSELCFNQGCKALVPTNKTACTRFCYYVFSITTQALNTLGKGTTFLELSADALSSFVVPCPSFPEQQAIAAFLDQETAKIDTLIEKAKQSIELMKERRSALISAAVTGKIDVRKVV